MLAFRRLARRSPRALLMMAVSALGAACADAPVAPTGAASVAESMARAGGLRYVVTLRDSVADAPATSRRLLARVGGAERHVFRRVLKGFAATMSDSAAAELTRHPAVESVRLDRRVQMAELQSGATWGIDRVDQRGLPLSASYAYGRTGAGVTAYILDTGIRFDHVDFGGRAVSGIDFIDGGPADDCQGHGTHVAGTIGGATYGVAKGVTLVAVRVLDCDGSGWVSDVAAGLDWVTQTRTTPAVANLSLNGSADAGMDAAVRRAVGLGVSVVVAAGNFALDACITSPAREPVAITVGATMDTDARAYFSNFGACIDLFAPGVGIVSAWHTSPTATSAKSGTSMASPHVAGAAALFLQGAPAASPAAVETALIADATIGAVTGDSLSPNRLLFVPAYAVAGGTLPNRAPTATTFSLGTNEDAVASLTLGGSDPDGDAVTFEILSQPSHGTLSGSAPALAYRPAANYFGPDAFTYRVADARGLASSVTTVSIAVASVNDVPVARAAGPGAALEGAMVAFTSAGSVDVDGDPLTYAWSFGDTRTGTGAAPTHAFVDNGAYTVTLTVSDGRGGSSSATTSMVVSNATPSVAAGNDTTIAAGNAAVVRAIFSDAGTVDSKWQGRLEWGDGAVSAGALGAVGWLPSLSHVYAAPGTYRVKVTVTDKDGAVGTDVRVVTVGAAAPTTASPIAVVGGPSTGVEGTAVAFSGAGSTPTGGALTYAWDFGDGSTGTGVSGRHAYADNGTYTVKLTVSNGTATSTATTTVTIANAAPVVNAGNDTTVAVGRSIALRSSFADAGIRDGKWEGRLEFGDGGSSAGTLTAQGAVPTLHRTYSTPGTYTVRVVIRDKDGATGTDVRLVTVTP